MDATSSLTRRKPPAEAPRGSTTLRLAVGSSKAELPLPRAVHRLSLLLNVIRRLGWLLITKGLPSALLLLRDALRAVLELVGALGARRAQFVCPSAPLRDCALQDDRPTTSHPVHFGRAQARTTARCASTSAGTASTSSRAARRAACGARRSTRSRRSTPSRRRRPPPTWRTEPAHARAGGASAARRSSSSTGRSWAGHDDDRAACDLGCLAYMSSVCVCGGVERGAWK